MKHTVNPLIHISNKLMQIRSLAILFFFASLLAAPMLLQAQTNSTVSKKAPIFKDTAIPFKAYIDDNTGDHISGIMDTRMSVKTLLGQPIVTCTGKWNFSSVTIGGETYDSKQSGYIGNLDKGAQYLPEEVIREIYIYNAKIELQPIWLDGTLRCDPGIFKHSGSDKWSFTFPYSPSWNELVYSSGVLGDKFQSEKEAKDYVISLSDASTKSYNTIVQEAEVNLWAARIWIEKLKNEAAEAQYLAQKKRDEEGITGIFNNIFENADDKAEERSKATEAFAKARENLKSIEKQGKKKAAELASASTNARENHDGSFNNKQLEKINSSADPINATHLLIAEKNEKIVRFKDKETHRYGYRFEKSGKVILKPQFKYAGSFSHGMAMVKYPNETGELRKPTVPHYRRDYDVKHLIDRTGQTLYKDPVSFSGRLLHYMDGFACVQDYSNAQSPYQIEVEFDSGQESISLYQVGVNTRPQKLFSGTRCTLYSTPGISIGFVIGDYSQSQYHIAVSDGRSFTVAISKGAKVEVKDYNEKSITISEHVILTSSTCRQDGLKKIIHKTFGFSGKVISSKSEEKSFSHGLCLG